MSRYEVTGLSFRGHRPGETFEAVLEPTAERRALRRRSIRLVDTSSPGLRPGTYRLPRGWHNPTEGGLGDG